ncbi:MAG: hypothetical protein ABC595_00330 [Candidatus Methanosuratincola petrocarbonis]
MIWVGGKRGLKALSRVVEGAIEEETGDRIIVEALGTMLGGGYYDCQDPLGIEPFHR